MVAKQIAGVFFDKHDLPVHLDGGGDGLQRLGFFHTALAIRRVFMGITDSFFEYDHGHLVASLDKLKFFNDPPIWRRGLEGPESNPFGKFAPGRDQFRPIYTALALYDCHPRCREYLLTFKHLHEGRSLYAYQNFDIRKGGEELVEEGYNAKLPFGYRVRGDIGTAQDKNLFARGNNGFVWWHGDYLTLAQSHHLRYERNMDSVGDDLNHLCVVMLGWLKRRTYLSAQALEVYKHRAPNLGTTELKERHAVQGALSWYFRPPAPVGLAELWRPIIEMYL